MNLAGALTGKVSFGTLTISMSFFPLNQNCEKYKKTKPGTLKHRRTCLTRLLKEKKTHIFFSLPEQQIQQLLRKCPNLLEQSGHLSESHGWLNICQLGCFSL